MIKQMTRIARVCNSRLDKSSFYPLGMVKSLKITALVQASTSDAAVKVSSC